MTDISRNTTFIVRFDVIPDSGEDISVPTYLAGLKLSPNDTEYTFPMDVTVDIDQRAIVCTLDLEDVQKLELDTIYYFCFTTTLGSSQVEQVIDEIRIDQPQTYL